MRVETRLAEADVRQESGNTPDPAPKLRASHAPALTLIARTPSPLQSYCDRCECNT